MGTVITKISLKEVEELPLIPLTLKAEQFIIGFVYDYDNLNRSRQALLAKPKSGKLFARCSVGWNASDYWNEIRLV